MSGPLVKPEPGELRAVCWDHNTCDEVGNCACTCHAPRLFGDAA